MEALDLLQGQLESLRELRALVKTMKALSAASIRQYERAVAALADYYRTVELGLHVVLQDLQEPSLPRRGHGLPRLGAVVFGSDHGLCGRFNEEITGYALERMDATVTDPVERLVLAVGARAAAGLERHRCTVEEDFFLPGSAAQITKTVQQILLKIDAWREQENVHYVYLFYNRHVGGSGYRPTGIELLPVSPRRFRRVQEQAWPSRSLPIFTMNQERLATSLLRQYFFMSIFRACAESQASEHSSRLSAMQAAERNLDERVEQVTNAFRRARQDAITAELLDVVTGFEAATRRR
jgi:F-type H+-transporting ATPase subunit gamma